MKKTDELRDVLTATFSDRKNWNRHIEIMGDVYVYISCYNEIRRQVVQPSGTILVPCACFSGANNGKNVNGWLVWCC